MNIRYIEENHSIVKYTSSIMVTSWVVGILLGIGDIFIDYNVNNLYEIILVSPLVLVAIITLDGTPQVKIPEAIYHERPDTTLRLLSFGFVFWVITLSILFYFNGGT